MTENESPRSPEGRNPPPSPHLPGKDRSQPPYTPGGVPEPEGSGMPRDNETGEDDPSSTLPPKLDP